MPPARNTKYAYHEICTPFIISMYVDSEAIPYVLIQYISQIMHFRAFVTRAQFCKRFPSFSLASL